MPATWSHAPRPSPPAWKRSSEPRPFPIRHKPHPDRTREWRRQVRQTSFDNLAARYDNAPKMGNGPKIEFPPLLPLGFWPTDLHKLRQDCVVPFPTSSTRVEIMDKLEAVVNALAAAGVKADIWIDGSFLTEKIDPDDSDIVVSVDGIFAQSATKQQKDALTWVGSDLRSTHRCHSFMYFHYPRGHGLYQQGLWMQSYWVKQFGFARNPVQAKGMALISLS